MWEAETRRVAQWGVKLQEQRALHAIRRRLASVRQALAEVDRFLAPSRFLRERFIEFGIPAEKILYKDNGFDLAQFRSVRRPPPYGRRVVFAYIGTLVEHKGVHVLIEAFNRLGPAAAELRIHGDLHVFPQYTAQLRALATHPEITFAGVFDNREVGRILAEVDALVVPSLWFENSPLTIHEALLAGVPVIASRLGGMAEYVEHGRTGLLFRPGDAEDLCTQLEWVLAHPQAFAAMPSPRYASMDEHARELVALYQELLGRRQSSASLSAAKERNPSPPDTRLGSR
jgi:glycosyltransferase involved in cell wall biosynthesis